MTKRFNVPLGLVALSSDPASGTEGNLYFNTTSDVVRVYANGAWADVGGSASNGLPTGGTEGQILAKVDGTNYNVTWIDNFTPQVKHLIKAGESITKGQAVYVSSADGTNMIVSKASNASESTSSKVMGLVASTLATNDQGYVVTEGLLAGLDTSAAGSVGDPVWLGTSGNLLYGLANKPVAPAHLVYIGVVTRKSATVGEIYINVQNGFELEELHDVLIDGTPADNEVLAYDSTSSLWINQTASEAGLINTSDIGTSVQAYDADLSAIAGLTGTSGFLTKTATNTWALDTNNYAQDSFKTIAVSGQSNVNADSATDTLTFVAGSNVTITTNSTTDSVTFASTDTNYYPSAIVWNAGTTSGPTLDLTMSGSGAPDLTAVAIPSASSTASGIITTGTQSIAGSKTFNSDTVIGNGVTAASLSIYGASAPLDTANALNVGGSINFSGDLLGPDGSASDPSYTFNNYPGSGMYMTSANVLALSANSSEKLTLGTNVSITNAGLICSDVYSNAVTSARTVLVNSNGRLGTSSSTRRVKSEITDITSEIQQSSVLDLDIVKFKYNADIAENGENAKFQLGFIAEQAQELGLDYLYLTDSEGIPDYFVYEKLAIYLLAELKTQKEEFNSLKARIEALENQ